MISKCVGNFLAFNADILRFFLPMISFPKKSLHHCIHFIYVRERTRVSVWLYLSLCVCVCLRAALIRPGFTTHKQKELTIKSTLYSTYDNKIKMTRKQPKTTTKTEKETNARNKRRINANEIFWSMDMDTLYICT